MLWTPISKHQKGISLVLSVESGSKKGRAMEVQKDVRDKDKSNRNMLMEEEGVDNNEEME